MSGAGCGGGLGWTGHGHGAVGAYVARRRATAAILRATEDDLRERGLPVPLSRTKVFWIGFACGLAVGLLIGFIVWELT